MLPLCLRHFTFYIPARASFVRPSPLQRANRVSSPPDDELLLWGRAANVKKGKRNGKKWQEMANCCVAPRVDKSAIVLAAILWTLGINQLTGHKA